MSSPIISFVTEFDEKLRVGQSRRKKEAAGYNLFRILGIERLETEFHSKMLADLFDPNGSHAQGDIFLLKFLQHLHRKGLIDSAGISPNAAGYIVERESGKIDLSIKKKGNLYIAIENKIDAIEQPCQLSRYRKKIDSYSEEYPLRELFYLTLDGKSSDTAREDQYHRLSYKEDIVAWLTACISEALPSRVPLPPRVLGTLLQYRETVERLTDMTKFLENDAAAKFVAEPDKFKIALQVINKIESAKSLLQCRFWEAVKSRLKNNMKDRVALSLKADPSDSDTGIVLYTKDDPEAEQLALQLFQYGSDSRLFFSVSLFGKRNDEKFKSLQGKAETALLVEELRKRYEEELSKFYERVHEFERPFLAWFYRDTFLRLNGTAEKLASDMPLVVSDICRDFEEFAGLCAPFLQKIAF